MPRKNYHEHLRSLYIKFMAIRDLIHPPSNLPVLEQVAQIQLDLQILQVIKETRYPRGRTQVPKSGNLHLAWEYAENPEHHGRFQSMLRVSPVVFEFLVLILKDHPIFKNNSNNPQAPVDVQLAVTLYRMGRFGNGACLEDLARIAGCSEGTVEAYTERCFTAIESVHHIFVRALTEEAKEVEKEWIDQHMGFRGLWREGYLMYDGTIVVLYAKPAKDGDAYFTRKSNYGLNVQIGNVPSNLRIVDFCHGFTGSAHDSAAFQYTCAAKHPQYLFKGEEFAWADSAYTLTPTTIPVHWQPASFIRENAIFDKAVSHLRVRSEHCMGALKGRFQSLRGLRVNISSNYQHAQACRWITVAIILHNIVIDVEGAESAAEFVPLHHGADEEEDVGHGEDWDQVADVPNDETGEEKRRRLTVELLAFRDQL